MVATGCSQPAWRKAFRHRPGDACACLREFQTRALARIIVATAAVLTAALAQAQTYDPTYPVCMRVYSIDGKYIECRYTSLAQCAASASGRGAMCVTNPYHQTPLGKAYRQAPRAY